MMAIVAWRLGLGWLVGRWLLLLTTAERRAAVPFRLFAGTFYLEQRGELWERDLGSAPTATVQAWPGPRAVRAREVTDPEELELNRRLWGDDRPVIALEPTGQRSPDMTPPDLVWVWPIFALVWWGARRR